MQNKGCTEKQSAVWTLSTVEDSLQPENTLNRRFFDQSKAVIERWGPGFPPATMNVAPGYLQRKIEEKWNQKKSLAVLFPVYLLYLPGTLKSQ